MMFINELNGTIFVTSFIVSKEELSVGCTEWNPFKEHCSNPPLQEFGSRSGQNRKIAAAAVFSPILNLSLVSITIFFFRSATNHFFIRRGHSKNLSVRPKHISKAGVRCVTR